MSDYFFLKENENANCSTILVGKDASVTGKVLLGHNEDDEDCIVQLHYVPRFKHKPGSVITFPDAKAVIPQVEETYAYYWSEVRCKGGISFADGFANEHGVVVVSNACRPSKDATGCEKDNREAYDMGYALRRLVAERAKTAREGVLVAAWLIETFGYFSSRSYSIADKDEAWVVRVPKGHNYVARRVGDDEVFYIPNHYTIHEVDFTDTEHKKFYWSENVVKFAIENGWYTPAVEGDYSDFDFAAAYQDGPLKPNNILRARNAWRLLKGVELSDDEIKPFTFKADKKYCAEDLKKVLSFHYEGTPDDETDGYTRNPHRTGVSSICGNTTVESIVVEFNDDINLTRMLRASPKPCITPYAPWYPVALTRIPKGYNWMGPEAAQASHFFVDDAELDYDPAKAWWTFRTLHFFTEFDYKGTNEYIKKSKAALEAQWETEKAGIERAYLALKDVDMDAAREVLTSYTCRQSEKSWQWAKSLIRTLGEEKIAKNCDEWK